MGNKASWNATGNHCQLTKEQEGSRKHSQRTRPGLHHSQSLIDSPLWIQLWGSESKCTIASNGTVLSRYSEWEPCPPDTPCLGWNPAISGSGGWCAQGVEGYSNFHRRLKIACPLSRTKKESPANNHSSVLAVWSIWSENVSFFRRGLGNCRHHACCPE